jgi:hypothetical protein
VARAILAAGILAAVLAVQIGLYPTAQYDAARLAVPAAPSVAAR